MKKTLIFFTLLVIIPAFASGEDETQADDWVVEHYSIAYSDMTNASVNASYEIYEAMIPNFGRLSADEIRAISPEIIDDLKTYSSELYNSTMAYTFPNAERFFLNVIIDNESLEKDDDQDRYKPPIIVYVNGNVRFTAEDYKMENVTKLYDVIYGALKMGARVTKEFRLSADAGHYSIYEVIPPVGVKVIGENSDRALWNVDNLDGLDAKSEIHSFTVESMSPNPTYGEDVDVYTDIDIPEIGEIDILTTISVKSVDASEYGIIPESVSNLRYISADGIRLACSSNLTDWNVIYEKAIMDVELKIESELSELFNVSVDLKFYWNNDTLEGYNLEVMKGRAVKSFLKGEIKNNTIFGLDKDVVKGFLNAGARIEFAIDFWAGKNYTYHTEITLPENLALHSDATEQEGKRKRYEFESLLEATLFSELAPQYNSDKAFASVFIDIYSTELTITTLNIKSRVDANVDFYRMRTPDEIKDTLPENVSISYVNSDAIRLALDKGLISNQDFGNIIDRIRTEIEEIIENAVGQKADVKIEVENSTMREYSIEEMNDLPPIRVKAEYNLKYSTSEIRIEGRALLKFSLHFLLGSIEGWNITYKVFFPDGIDVLSIKDDLSKVERGRSNGRDYFKVLLTSGDGDDEVVADLDVSYILILEKVVPCTAFIVTLIIIAVIIRKVLKTKEE